MPFQSGRVVFVSDIPKLDVSIIAATGQSIWLVWKYAKAIHWSRVPLQGAGCLVNTKVTFSRLHVPNINYSSIRPRKDLFLVNAQSDSRHFCLHVAGSGTWKILLIRYEILRFTHHHQKNRGECYYVSLQQRKTSWFPCQWKWSSLWRHWADTPLKWNIILLNLIFFLLIFKYVYLFNSVIKINRIALPNPHINVSFFNCDYCWLRYAHFVVLY